jgi:methionyl-tRNA formyltransferase
MRIVLIGQQAFGQSVLEAILEAGKDEVVGVFCSPDHEGRREDPLKAGAVEKDIPVFQPGRFRSVDAIQQFNGLYPDLCVMAYVTDIVPMEMIDGPTHGTIQYHPSLLPLHRGPSSINWPIMMGETRTGLTIFWPDEGLDTGPVLLQKEVQIGPDDTLGSVYFNSLYPMGISAMLESIDLVRDGNAPKIVQDESKATYESWVKASDGAFDWVLPAQQIYTVIRGCNPQPGAGSTYADERLRIFDSALGTSGMSGSEPGTVISSGEEGFEVATGDGSVLVKRVQRHGGQKEPAAEFASAAGLKIGDRLG